MSKIAITYGDFDCFNTDHFFLIKEMRKIVMPDNKLVVIIPDDYPVFFQKEYFPVQDINHRMKNLSFLVSDIRVCLSNDPSSLMFEIISNLKKQGIKLFMLVMMTTKIFPARKHHKTKDPNKVYKKIWTNQEYHGICEFCGILAENCHTMLLFLNNLWWRDIL
jgi:glycerol-3-phosphate cytidylyltransferase-like family protein